VPEAGDGVTDGLVVVDKPAGWTSHDVVARCRKVFGQKRVGHAGTLDPPATGVLLVGLGRATRLLRFLTALPKSYECDLVLGVETSTLDDEGEITATHEMAGVTLDDVRTAAAAFVGEIAQVPPMVSARKVDGKRLHELAREGIEVEREARNVTVHALAIEEGAGDGTFRLSVTCSSGTYVRTLAADIGAALGGGAHLRGLRRTASGSFLAVDAVPLDDVGPGAVLSPAEALRDYPRVVLGEDDIRLLETGRRLPRPEGAGPWAMVDAAGNLLAVYEDAGDGLAKAAVVVSAR
jgi:tRNA pseudouridine55 synthase